MVAVITSSYAMQKTVLGTIAVPEVVSVILACSTPSSHTRPTGWVPDQSYISSIRCQFPVVRLVAKLAVTWVRLRRTISNWAIPFAYRTRITAWPVTLSRNWKRRKVPEPASEFTLIRVWALTSRLEGARNTRDMVEPFDSFPPTPLPSCAPKAPEYAAAGTTALIEPAAGPMTVLVQLEKSPVSKPSENMTPMAGVAVGVLVGVFVAVSVGVFVGVALGV